MRGAGHRRLPRAEFTREADLGSTEGYLADKGLIPLAQGRARGDPRPGNGDDPAQHVTSSCGSLVWLAGAGPIGPAPRAGRTRRSE